MGGHCYCGNRGKDEEEGICRAERMLNLQSISAKRFAAEIRKVAENNVLTMQQFNTALKAVGVCYDQHEQRARIYTYLNQFGSVRLEASMLGEVQQKTLLPQRDLIFLGIFLSRKDSLFVKAELLFDTIDTEEIGCISADQFTDAFEDIFRIVADNVFVLASGNEKSGFVNSNLLASYLQNLELGKKVAIPAMQRLVFERSEMVTKYDFIHQMVAIAVFLSSKGLREFFFEKFRAEQLELIPEPKKKPNSDQEAVI